MTESRRKRAGSRKGDELRHLDPQERVRRIEEFIRDQTRESTVRVTGLERLVGGSSRQVWSLDVGLGQGASQRLLPLVLRINPVPDLPGGLADASGGFAGEFELLRAVGRQGAPVPGVHWRCEDRERLGGPFYLMDRIEGETIPRRIYRVPELAGALEGLPAQLGRALAQIHRTSIGGGELDWLPGPPPGRSSPESQIESIQAGLRFSPDPRPTLELAHRWLCDNVPPEGDRTLVHGDFRIGNIVVGPDGLRSVLDWELSHIGDPHEDLAWMCTKTWRFGRNDRPVGGVGTREDFYRAYEDESGRKLDREVLRYWEVLGSAKVVCVWIFQVGAYLSGLNPSVEQAAIGRRMAETELDLLDLLDGTERDGDPAPGV